MYFTLFTDKTTRYSHSRHPVPEEAHADVAQEDDERPCSGRTAQPAASHEHQRQRGHHDRVQPQLRVRRWNLHPTGPPGNPQREPAANQVS